MFDYEQPSWDEILSPMKKPEVQLDFFNPPEDWAESYIEEEGLFDEKKTTENDQEDDVLEEDQEDIDEQDQGT